MSDIYLTMKPTKQVLSHTWYTSIQKTVKGSEKRSKVFNWPRVNIDTGVFVGDTARSSWLRAKLFRHIDGTWGQPLWTDRTTLDGVVSVSGTYLDCEIPYRKHIYEGRDVILLDDSDWTSYEVCEVSSATTSGITITAGVTSKWSAGTYVMPLVDCRIKKEATVSRQVRQADTLKLSCNETYEATKSYTYSLPSSGAPTYSGTGEAKDLFIYKPTSPMKIHYSIPYDLEQGIGLGYKTTYYDNRQVHIDMEQSLLLGSRENIGKILDFFDSKCGRLKSFWCPTWSRDVVFTEAIDSADVVIAVEDTDYNTDMLSNDIINRHIYIQFPDGSYVCRKITNEVDGDIVIDSAIGTSVSAANANKMLVSYLNLVRFDIDTIEIKFVTGAERDTQQVAYIDLYFKGLVMETT